MKIVQNFVPLTRIWGLSDPQGAPAADRVRGSTDNAATEVFTPGAQFYRPFGRWAALVIEGLRDTAWRMKPGETVSWSGVPVVGQELQNTAMSRPVPVQREACAVSYALPGSRAVSAGEGNTSTMDHEETNFVTFALRAVGSCGRQREG